MPDQQTLPPPGLRDPSLSLLDRIAEESLNPGYRAAMREHGDAPARRRGSLLTLLALTVVGLLAGLLVLGGIEQAGSQTSERRALLDLTEQARTAVQDTEARIAALDAEVSDLREASLANEVLGNEQAQTVTQWAVAAGAQPVSGPGARVVVDDSASVVDGPTSDLGRVLDIDLQQVVNGLWEAGAEAVAINGERVGALTAVRSVQDVVLVNYNPVVSPYVVEALGDPRTLATDFLASSGGRWLQAVNLSAGIGFGIDSISEPVTLPGQPVGSLRSAAPAEGTDAELAP